MLRRSGNGITGLPGTSSVGNLYLFSGRRYDAESRKFYFRFRYLDPILGRFMSRARTAAGGIGNRYSFASGNPINRVNPMGRRDIPGSPPR